MKYHSDLHNIKLELTKYLLSDAIISHGKPLKNPPLNFYDHYICLSLLLWHLPTPSLFLILSVSLHPSGLSTHQSISPSNALNPHSLHAFLPKFLFPHTQFIFISFLSISFLSYLCKRKVVQPWYILQKLYHIFKVFSFRFHQISFIKFWKENVCPTLTCNLI